MQKYTERIKKVLSLARKESIRLGHDYIGTEHILLGMIKEGGGAGYEALQNLNVDVEKVKSKLENKIGKRSTSSSSDSSPPITPNSEKVIEISVDFSKKLGHNYVGTEHLLYALVSTQDTVVYELLNKDFNLDKDKIEEEIIRILSSKKTEKTRETIGIYPFIDQTHKISYIIAGSWKDAVTRVRAMKEEGIKKDPSYSIKPIKHFCEKIIENAMEEPDKYDLPPLFQKDNIGGLRIKNVDLNSKEITLDISDLEKRLE